jgi:hypothetical protein
VPENVSTVVSVFSYRRKERRNEGRKEGRKECEKGEEGTSFDIEGRVVCSSENISRDGASTT